MRATISHMDNKPASKKTILIVDDEELLLEIYEAVFREEGFNVFIAKDGQEAWDILEKGAAPDIVFTGIKMPRMDGFTLVSKMRQNPKFAAIPVAISSHRGLTEHEEEAKNLGVSDFIIQGVTPPPEVVKRIKIILGIKSNFRVAISPTDYDAKALIAFLNRTQNTNYEPTAHQTVVLELEAQREEGGFSIKLMNTEESL